MKKTIHNYWKIRNGAILITSQNHVDLVDIKKCKRIPVDEKYSKDLIAIAMNLPGYPFDPDHLDYLHARGYILRSSSREDPYIKEKLRQLGSEFLWQFLLPFDENVRELYEFALSLHSQRKEISADYSQGPCLPETSVRRALELYRRHKEEKILLLGDDDLVSPILARLGASVTVMDVHRNLLEFLAYINREYGLNIEIICHDAAQPLPAHLSQKFGAVFTDPVSSEDWYIVFLSCAVAASIENGLVYIVVYQRRGELIRRVISRLGLVEKEVWQSFCHYYDEFFQPLPLYDAGIFVIRKPAGLEHSTLLPYTRIGTFSSHPDMEYSYDFHDCRKEISVDTCLKHIIPSLCKISQTPINEVRDLSKNDTIEFFFPSSHISIHLLGYKDKNYIGLTLLVPQGTDCHYPVVSLVNKWFKPARYMIAEMARFIE
jgi:hypothetical protein